MFIILKYNLDTGTLAEPRADEEANMDVSSSSTAVAVQPCTCRDGKHRTSGFNKNWLVDQKFSGWLYLTNYSTFCFVCVVLRENINNIIILIPLYC